MLKADREDITLFIQAIFCYADEGTYLSLRVFDQFDRGKPPLHIEGIRITANAAPLVEAAMRVAERAANATEPAVFAPPLATFRDAVGAKTSDLANCFVLSVELDAGDPQVALDKLELLLGPVTVIVASGGYWIDPEGTAHPKSHFHWRLNEPTRTAEEHAVLHHARKLAAMLVGADLSAAPPAHPLRWAGSYNKKKKNPNIAFIAGGTFTAEIDLADSLERLTDAIEAAGLGQVANGPRQPGPAQASWGRVARAVDAIPNDGVSWDEWVKMGMAIYAATGGDDGGLQVFDDWSAKSIKFKPGAAAERWGHFRGSPPTRIGAGTLFFTARAHGWQEYRPPEQPPPAEPPPAAEPRAEDDATPETPPDDDLDDDEKRAALWRSLGLDAWLEREIPLPPQLLGDFITAGSRTFLVGRTGLGKTLVSYGLAFGMASGRGFLHWRSPRPCNVLLVDGEMPPVLVQDRLRGEYERTGGQPLPGSLLCFSRVDDARFAALLPHLGPMPPLNTEEGQNWMLSLLSGIGPALDVVFFDNVMSLLVGDQKDELAWSGVLPLIDSITARGVAQVWLDHTGHEGVRQYGSVTKSWRFDTVGVMTPMPEGSLAPDETGMLLSFDYPGKARQRTPKNREDFEPVAIHLRDGAWSGEPAANAKQGFTREKLRGSSGKFYEALHDAIVLDMFPDGSTTLSMWKSECLRRGLIEPPEAGDTRADRNRATARFRNAKSNLLAAGAIGINGETVHDLRRKK